MTTKERGKVIRKEIYNFVKEYISQHNYSPTLREIGDGVGRGLTTVHTHVHRLVEMGVITTELDKPRTIRILTELIE